MDQNGRRDQILQYLPPIRGDGPTAEIVEATTMLSAPHTGGWTDHSWGRHITAPICPPYGGMDRNPRWPARSPPHLPPIRGDGPHTDLTRASGIQSAPHTGGWTDDFDLLTGWLQICPHPGDGPESDDAFAKRVLYAPPPVGVSLGRVRTGAATGRMPHLPWGWSWQLQDGSRILILPPHLPWG